MDLTKIQGFNNMGNTCFMNSALQILFRCSAFTKYMLNTQDFESKVLKCYKITLSDYFNPKVNSLEPTIIKRFIADKFQVFFCYYHQISGLQQYFGMGLVVREGI